MHQWANHHVNGKKASNLTHIPFECFWWLEFQLSHWYEFCRFYEFLNFRHRNSCSTLSFYIDKIGFVQNTVIKRGWILSNEIMFPKYDIPYRRFQIFHFLDLKLSERRNQTNEYILAATSNLLFSRSDVILSSDSVARETWPRHLSIWDLYIYLH
jgi:hypothetical protein